MEQLIRKWVMSCEYCIKKSRIDNRITRPALQNPSEHITEPEDTLQTDLDSQLQASGGNQNIVAAKDVFSRYLHTILQTKVLKQLPQF